MFFHCVVCQFLVIAAVSLHQNSSDSPLHHILCWRWSIIMSWYQPSLSYRHVLLALASCAPQLAVFCAECFGRPVSQEGAGRRCDSCVGHGYSDLHTSSWWIIKAVTIHWTCCVGLCWPDYPLVMIWSHTVLISLFQMQLWTVVSEARLTPYLNEIYFARGKARKGSGLANAATGLSAIKRWVIMAT